MKQNLITTNEGMVKIQILPTLSRRETSQMMMKKIRNNCIGLRRHGDEEPELSVR
jgi:hypothetical protein